MKLDYRQAWIYDTERIVDAFYRSLDGAHCPVGITIPDDIIVQAVMQQVMGYSPLRGTATRRVLNALSSFGIPPLVADLLLKQLSEQLSQRLGYLLGQPPGFTDHLWKPVDDTSILIMEK